MLDEAFAAAKREQRTALIPYVMAGDPDLETSLEILQAIARAGADCIELGIPYGDPLADGPTIAAAGQRALRHNVDTAAVLQLVKRFCAQSHVPVVLFTYYNPVYQYGIERFAREARAAGASGVIVPDIALEESQELRVAFASESLAMPLLIAPSTPPERAQRIAAETTGFLYIVSRLGVTGANPGLRDFDALIKQIESVRGWAAAPIAVGFGVSTARDVQRIGAFADAAIVGSALIDRLSTVAAESAGGAAEAFVRELQQLAS